MTTINPSDCPPGQSCEIEGGRPMGRDDVLKIVREAYERGERPNLYGADLYGADLYGANLSGADLRGARVLPPGLMLSVTGLPSGDAVAWPTPEGWQVRVGCWEGSTDDLQTLIDGDDWPEAEGEEQDRRRPSLAALIALAEAHAAMYPGVIDALAERWKDKNR